MLKDNIMLKSENIFKLILILYTISFMLSWLLKINIINFINIVLIGVICTIILFSNEKLLILSTLIASILCKELSDISGIFQYLPVYLYILMFVDIIIKKKKIKIDLKLKYIFILSIFFSIMPLLLNLDINIPNIIYSIFKRYCFIIIYFYIINSNLNYKDLSNIITKPLILLLLINVPIFIAQFVTGTDRDFITGIFGSNMTGIVSQLLMILLCIKLKDYYFRKVKLMNLLIWIIVSVIYCSIAEVKFGFFVIPILLLIFFLFIKRGLKSIAIISFISLLMIFGYNLYMKSYSQQNFLDANFLNHYLVEQSYSGDSLNRIGFISKIDSIVFNSKIDELFGKGIGSGNPSNFKFLQGSLYNNFDYLKYNWFALPYIYVETGVVGLILFIAIYVHILIKSYKSYTKYKSEQSLLILLITIITFMYLIYNNSILEYPIMFIYWSYFGILSKEVKDMKADRIVNNYPALVSNSGGNNDYEW